MFKPQWSQNETSCSHLA